MKKAFSILALIFLATCAVAQTNLGPIVTTSQDQIGTSTPPANPFSGNCRSYFNTNTGVITYINSIGGNCGPVAAAFPLTSAAQVQTGGSIAPSGIGQIIGNQLWVTVGPPAPVFSSATLTGGSLSATHGYSFRYTFLSAAGETLAGGELQLGGPFGACVSGTACTITLTAVTLPAGYTGYNTYMVDCGSGTCSGGEVKLAACTNLASGVGCTAITTGSGALPSTNTAFTTPSPLGTNLCSPGTNVFMWASDGANFYPYMGIDNANTGTNPPSPYNKLSICRPFWVNDSATDPPLGRNSLVLINHLQNGTTTNAANQDRGLQIFATNCLPDGNCSDSSTHYGLEGIQVEEDISGTPTINGSPDGEVTAGSFQLALFATTNYGATQYGTNAGRFTLFREPSAAVDTQGMNGINVAFQNNSTVSAGSAFATAIKANCINTATANNLFCSAIKVILPNTANRFTGQFGIYVPTIVSYAPVDGTDFLVRNDVSNLNSQLNGKVYFNTFVSNATSGFPATASETLTGALTMAQASMSSPTGVTCSGGASSYTYAFVGVDSNGGQVAGTGVNSAATCTNPLTSGNPAAIAFTTGAAAVANAVTIGSFVRIDIYRTGGPMGLGKIGSLTCSYNGPLNTCATFSDTGLTASGSIPTVNNTGGMVGQNFGTLSNCAGVGTAASPSVASCSGAAAGSFSCATNASGATCVVNTTAVTANSEILITQRTDTATGTRLGVTCNTTVSSVLPVVTAVTAQTSFTINLGTIVTNPECFSYSIVN